MEKNFKKFTSFPVALHSLNLNDGHFYPDLQNSANELYTILGLKKMPYIYIYPRSVYLYDVVRGLHVFKKFFKSYIYVRFDEQWPVMFFILAHEMYHEYQQRMSLSFVPEEIDTREKEANAFALAYCRLLSSRCNDTKNEWYKAPEEFGSDVYALSDEYAEKFNLPKSYQAN